MAEKVIRVENLSKEFKVKTKGSGLRASFRSLFKPEYKLVKAVQSLNFAIESGEMIGFIGPNGAGKTTTLKMLSGILYPGSGEVSVLGFRPYERKPEFLKQISLVMGQKNQLMWDLPPIDTFNLNAETYEVPKAVYQQTLKELVEIFEIEDILQQQVRRLSLGQRMRCEIVASLLHNPKILFLDEPTIGLDVLTQKKLRQFIKSYNQRYGTTIILTSHYMDDVKEIAQRVIIINQGNLVFDDSLSALNHRFADYKLLSLTLNQEADSAIIEKLAEYGEIQQQEYPKLALKVKPDKIAAATAAALQELDIDDIDIAEPKLEDIVGQIYSQQG